jgi:hypothetical protein
MESYYEDITPAMATEYLSRNGGGRNLSQSAVACYARDMANGNWRTTHQGIAFDADGNLRDGQHRMAAIVRSGVTVRMLIVKGIPREGFGVMDTGRGRTMADRLQIEGRGSDAVQLAAVARKALLWDAGLPWSRGLLPTREEISKFIDDNEDLLEAAKFAHAWPNRRILPSSAAGFAWWLFQGIDRQDADYFMERLRDGANLEVNDSIHVLRERLRLRGAHQARDINSGPGGRYVRTELMLALTIIAWNHYRKHNPITKLQLPSVLSDDNYPRPI